MTSSIGNHLGGDNRGVPLPHRSLTLAPPRAYRVAALSSGTSEGWTLVELAAVATLCAVVVSMGAPSLARTARRLQQEEQAWRVARLVTWTRQHAIVTGRPARLQIDAGARTCAVSTATPDGDGWRFEPVHGIRGGPLVLQVEHVTSSAPTMTCAANGRCETLTMRLADGDGAVRVVRVVPPGLRVEVTPP